VQGALTQEKFVWLIGSLCQINRIPFDPQLVLQRFPAPHALRQFLEALQSLGFKTGEHDVDPKGFGDVRFPCVGFLKGAAEGEDLRPALFAKGDGERLLYFPVGSQTASIAPLREFAQQFEPRLILVRHESAAAESLGDGSEPASKFGFRWFWTELLRHKRVWRDVLAASLFIQLIGLTTPLFTQVIIDKVIVHHTESTLAVIAVGLVMFMLFNASMSWLRQYLVLHTGNRVDAVLEQTMTLSILCAGALLVMKNDGFTIGMLVAFQMFASRMSQPMLRLAGLWQEFQQASIAVKRLGDIMDAPAEPHALTPTRTAEGKGELEIRDLSFRYSPAQPYLYRKLNLTIKPGKLTVLTGPSGSGKSTLAKLMLGFYMQEEGQILLDGKDIRNLSANELRNSYGVVPQDTVLFSGTIYENLIAANPNAAFGEVVQACKIAEIHEVIEKLPNGYNSLIGEHGVGLSGGQKQRLAIARAVLKRPKILIFDEATSSLDRETADRFAQTVNRLKGQVTILFVAHQVPKGLSVDEVVTLNSEKAARIHMVEEERP